MTKTSKKSRLKPVLIVVEKGIADVRYCPPGVVVFIKDYDGDCDEKCDSECHCAVRCKDGTMDNFHLGIATNAESNEREALKEAKRLQKAEM